jgi:large subunit ribosomal protein L13
MTKATKQKEIERHWHLFDVKEKTLGRIATVIAQVLMGKDKTYFVRNLDCGDYAVVINAQSVHVTGRKETQKIYTKYSGYPGGLGKESLANLRERRPEEIIKRAVYGMLPKNKLRDTMIKRLYVYPDANHPYQAKIETKA